MENRRIVPLDFDFPVNRDKKHFTIVNNFPGLLAEMNAVELRAMALELQQAAEKLDKLNGK